MAVTAELVKTLREKTGAGMMDCKKALNETNGDMENAIDWLRKKGLSAAAKKAGRVASEGKVLTGSAGRRAILVEINLETDFASKSDAFNQFAGTVVQMALDHQPADLEALQATLYPTTGRPLHEEVKHQIATIGENMTVRRYASMTVSQGVVASYIHMGGKIGVLVALESAVADQALLQELGKKLAMHVAASAPLYLNRESVPAEAIEREKAILVDQARTSGKPEAIIEKMVQGRLNKFYGDVCFVEQMFIMDQDNSVASIVAAAAKTSGGAITVTGFVRFVLGDGIEKEEKNFADEVAAQLGS
ncbi:MAG: elongation factor Ts [Magnetococcales bacterium]|nr:elongation factor Ts [Magnetococcales bacterium]